MWLDLVAVAVLFAVVVVALVLALDREMTRMRRDFSATRLVKRR